MECWLKEIFQMILEFQKVHFIKLEDTSKFIVDVDIPETLLNLLKKI